MARPAHHHPTKLQLLLDKYGTGSLEQVLAALTFACDKAVQLLQTDDERTVLRGIHALAQAASQYARVYEVAELAERVQHLEKELGLAEGYVAGPN